MNSNYYDGFYMAYGIIDGSNLIYNENYVTGPSKAIGSGHHHHIKYLGDGINYWRSTIDSGYSWDVYGWAGDGTHDAGIEVNNGSSKLNHTASNQTTLSGLQYFEDGAWHNWTTSAKMISEDPFNTGIKVSQSPGETSAFFWK